MTTQKRNSLELILKNSQEFLATLNKNDAYYNTSVSYINELKQALNK